MKNAKFPPINMGNVRGWLRDTEGRELMKRARQVAHKGPCLEIGSYCGKSAIYIGHVCSQKNNVLFAVDHHCGSIENQKKGYGHDPYLYKPEWNSIDSFPEFRKNIHNAGLEQTVIPMVAPSDVVAQNWKTPLALLFIDGDHTSDGAVRDYLKWQEHVVDGGILAFHDIRKKPNRGKQGPNLALDKALASGEFFLLAKVNTLGILRCKRRSAGARPLRLMLNIRSKIMRKWLIKPYGNYGTPD
jgi:predicted O-methyltransferase YrrM